MERFEILLRVTGAAISRGKFITLEGGEGVGKSTQLMLLGQALRDRGLDVVETREPGGTDGAEAIRSLLLSGAEDRWNPRAEALLFAAARSDHVARVIQPALDRGAWVICDRYIDSSRAYQSGASGLVDADLMELHRIGSDGLMPDCTLVLTLPVNEAAARAALRDEGQSDRFGSRGLDYHANVANAFLAYANASPDRFRLINASGTTEEVHGAIVKALAGLGM